MGLWRDMTSRLFDLEARLVRQTSATELQTTTVKRLKDQVDSGRVDPEVLRREELVLNKMQVRRTGRGRRKGWILAPSKTGSMAYCVDLLPC